jgi:acetoin utilization protein AcuB
MHEHQFRRLPVIDDKGRLVGIVSERDLLYASPPPDSWVSGLNLSHLVAELKLSEVMTRDVITAAPDTFVEDAASLMVAHKIGGLPVVDRDRLVVGVITETDIFRAFIELYSAGHEGLYLTLEVRDRAGLTAELSKAVLGLGSDIVGISSSYDEAAGHCRLLIKGPDIDSDRVVALLESRGHDVVQVHQVRSEHNHRKGKEMENRILVPLDGSSLAERALSCALMLAQELPAELVLLRAFWIPPDVLARMGEAAVELDLLAGELEAEAEDYLSALAKQLAETGLDVRHVVERGPAAEMILEHARQEHISHIVMATHGYSGLRRWTHGSVAERVLQTATVPVLLVRVGEEDVEKDWQQPMSCQRILVPLDGSLLAEQILPVITPVAEALAAELIFFQVSIAHTSGWMTGEWYLPVQGVLETAEEDAEEYLRAVADELRARGLDTSTSTAIGSVANCIVDYAEANQVDLIAMCTHGRTGLARWALGSVADRVLRAGSTPILLVRAQ